MYDALARVRDTLVGFGGHHAAAGVDVASDRVETLRERFSEACAAMGVPDTAPRWAADALLEEGDDPARVLGDLARFEPCGQSNPSPRVASARARVLGVRELRGGHLKAWLEVGGTRISCFGPEMGPSPPGSAAMRGSWGPSGTTRTPAAAPSRCASLAAEPAEPAEPAAPARCSGVQMTSMIPPGQPLVRFAGVHKRFGPKVIFTGLDLEIRRGETITVMGASGSGKSVMLKMLIGLLKPDAGRDPVRRPRHRQDEATTSSPRSAGASRTSSRAPRCSTRSPSARTSPTACASSSGTR